MHENAMSEMLCRGIQLGDLEDTNHAIRALCNSETYLSSSATCMCWVWIDFIAADPLTPSTGMHDG